MNRWQKLINELSPFLTQKEIGERIGRSQATISDISKGKQKFVIYEDGEKLLALHAEFYEKRHKPDRRASRRKNITAS